MNCKDTTAMDLWTYVAVHLSIILKSLIRNWNQKYCMSLTKKSVKLDDFLFPIRGYSLMRLFTARIRTYFFPIFRLIE